MTLRGIEIFFSLGGGVYGSDRDVLFTTLDEDFSEVSLVLTFKVHLRLICFDFDEDVSRGDFVAGVFLPGPNCALSHGRTQCWHCYYRVVGECYNTLLVLLLRYLREITSYK